MSLAFLLTDLRGQAVSELAGATGKTFTRPLRSAASASVTIDGDDPVADFALEGDALARIYEVDDTFTVDGARELVGHLRLVGASESSSDDSSTVQMAFADPYWVLGRRRLGRTGAFSAGSSLDLQDAGSIIASAVGLVNTESPSGLRVRSVLPSTMTYVDEVRFKPVDALIGELSGTLDGPDWRVRPIEWDNGYYGEMEIAPVIGQVRPDCVFESGSGRANVASYIRGVTVETLANRIASVPAGFPGSVTEPTGPVIEALDAESIAQRGLFDAEVGVELSVEALSASLVATHLAARRNPKQTITFEPRSGLTPTVPRFGTEYDVGDIVPFRAVRNNIIRIDALFRVYAYTVSVDDNGTETPSITVTPS